MKKYIVLVLLTLFLVGCGAEASQPQADSLVASSGHDTVVRQDYLIVDQSGVKIMCTGIELVQYLPDQPEGYMLVMALTIDNASDTDITVLPMSASVNGITKTPGSGVPMSAAGGKKALTTFVFAELSGTGIDSANDIDKVDEIEFYLSVVDDKTSQELFRSEEINIKPQG